MAFHYVIDELVKAILCFINIFQTWQILILFGSEVTPQGFKVKGEVISFKRSVQINHVNNILPSNTDFLADGLNLLIRHFNSIYVFF